MMNLYCVFCPLKKLFSRKKKLKSDKKFIHTAKLKGTSNAIKIFNIYSKPFYRYVGLYDPHIYKSKYDSGVTKTVTDGTLS